jgi:glycosyltransferase involved in cell wall biosynthesis
LESYSEEAKLKKIKILYLTWSADLAGMLYEEVKAFSDAPDYVQDVCFCTKGKGIFYDKIKALGYEPHILGMWSKYNPLSSLIGGLRLRRLIREGSYDVMHLQEVILPFPFLAAALSDPKIPLVLHNPGEFHLPDNTLRWFGQQLKKFVYWMVVGRLVDVLICNSNYIIHKTPIQDKYRRKLVVVYNAIDMQQIEGLLQAKQELRKKLRASLQLAENAFIVTVVARLVEVKRIDRFIQAIALLNKSGLKVTVLIVGEGVQRSKLENLAKQQQCDNIIFTGYRSDAKEVTAGSDIFVLPSCGEAFGISALEALSLDVPLMVFEDVGGPREFVKDGENGFVVKDAKDLCDKIAHIIKNPGLIAGSNEHPLIDRNAFNITTYAETLKKLYRALLTAGRGNGFHATKEREQ